MNKYAQLVMDYLDQEGVGYEDHGHDILTVAIDELKVFPQVIVIFSPQEEKMASFRVRMMEVPEDKYIPVILHCNTLNYSMSLLKFYLGDEGRLWCHADLVLDEETCQDNCMRMVLTLAQVADEKIPEFMEIISNAPIPRPAS